MREVRVEGEHILLHPHSFPYSGSLHIPTAEIVFYPPLLSPGKLSVRHVFHLHAYSVNAFHGQIRNPQFVRKEWTNLNGEWEFRMDDQNEGEKERWFEGLKQSRKIQVPFT